MAYLGVYYLLRVSYSAFQACFWENINITGA